MVPVPVSPEEREKPPKRSLSMQCTSDGSEECGTKCFAQGRVLCNTDHADSLDPGAVSFYFNQLLYNRAIDWTLNLSTKSDVSPYA